MRRAKDNAWSVEIAPRAWDELGVVSGDAFRKLKRALDVVRDALQSGELKASSAKQFVTAAGYVARYRMDETLRTVVLEEVRPDDAAPDELTSTGRRRRKG